MIIGVLSDTHGYLDPRLKNYFSDVDEIWHAGDIGTVETFNQLQKIKSTQAVFGNIDGADIRNLLPETICLNRLGVKILITHIAGSFQKYNAKTKHQIAEYKPHILVCGHSHICKVAFDKKFNLLYINPGAAGNHGFHLVKTILKFKIVDNNQIKDMQVIELGKRGQTV